MPTSSTNISKTPLSLWKSQTIRARKPPIVAQHNRLPTRNSWRVFTKCEPKSNFYSSLAAILSDKFSLQDEILHARWFNVTFLSPSWDVTNKLWKGHVFTIPKRSPAILWQVNDDQTFLEKILNKKTRLFPPGRLKGKITQSHRNIPAFQTGNHDFCRFLSRSKISHGKNLWPYILPVVWYGSLQWFMISPIKLGSIIPYIP